VVWVVELEDGEDDRGTALSGMLMGSAEGVVRVLVAVGIVAEG
jgi:hypothetical protein